eukprot:c7599_g1_i2.p1 GENE.c7599_g1_i2~~c7599_g1_i2.p1  ORF type:complete len:317 (+),score=102.07 c7599_g1_i2:115-951(+)
MDEQQLNSAEIAETSDKALGIRTLVILACASFVEFVSAARYCDREARTCSDEYAFALAVGLITTVLSILLFIVGCTRAGIKNIFNQIFSFLMLIFWSAGAGINTFVDPFTTVGNGYFSSWLAFGASVYLVFLSVPVIRRLSLSVHSRVRVADNQNKTAVVILIASIIELVSAAVVCQRTGNCEKYVAWALFVGVASIFFVLVYLIFSSCLGRFRVIFPVLLVITWIPGCGVLTFESPFAISGNGYFSSWIALFFSIYWITLCFPDAKIPLRSGSKATA